MKRRTFLKYAANTVASASATLAFPGIVKANTPWAVLPASVGDLPKYKVLEIFCPGGASQWENFWVSHDGPSGGDLNSLSLGGATDHLNWRGLGEYVAKLQWQNCPEAPAFSTQTKPFEVDENGTPVSWGPATSPLWRQDIFNRCRMMVTKHSEDLHAFASFRTMTGRRFGSPRAASLGAAIQHHFQSLPQQQDIPYSYVFAPKHLGVEYYLTHSTLIGQHPGPSLPLGLKVGDPIGGLLKRQGISSQADQLFNELRNQYRDLLRWQGSGSPVRSPDFSSYDAASHYLVNAGQLDNLLGGDMLQAGTTTPCTSDPEHSFEALSNPTKRSLELAAHMLSNGARHITVIDGGLPASLLRNSSRPYDAHNNSTGQNRSVVESTSVHLFNLLQSLAAIIDGSSGSPQSGLVLAAPSGPKINLDDTLVLIHTEFNRTPSPGIGVNEDDYAYAGREHFPDATLAVLIGGPVTGRAIQGGIILDNGSAESAIATHPLSPTDVHAGVLLAAGIDPLAPDNFTVGDDFSVAINPGGNAYSNEIRSNLKNKVLGISGQIDSLTF